MGFPRTTTNVELPPIIIQGCKTRLIDFIFRNINWSPKKNGRWVEPFLGSGIVLLNAIKYGQVRRALVSDINPYIVKIYESLYEREINFKELRDYFFLQTRLLKEKGESYYYELRNEFNETKNIRLLLFLNTCCFRNLMRFNSSQLYNAPFDHTRFRRLFDNVKLSFLLETLRRIKRTSFLLNKLKTFEIECVSFRDVLPRIKDSDFSYFDPPYLGTITTYFGETFDYEDWDVLVEHVLSNVNPACISNWHSKGKKKNDFVCALQESVDDGKLFMRTKEISHNIGYGIGENSKEINECLILNPKAYITRDEEMGILKYI